MAETQAKLDEVCSSQGQARLMIQWLLQSIS